MLRFTECGISESLQSWVTGPLPAGGRAASCEALFNLLSKPRGQEEHPGNSTPPRQNGSRECGSNYSPSSLRSYKLARSHMSFC